MNVDGKILVIGETNAYGDNNFLKRNVVVETEEQYPQKILIEFVQDKCDILNTYDIGDRVSVGINLRGREWVNPQGETKYFNSIQGWKISKTSGGNAPAPAKVDNAPDLASDEDYDDLPF